MKQLIFMIMVTLVGVLGSLNVDPFYGVVVYYFFAVLRPQFIWKWSLPDGVAWSFYVAIAAMIGAGLQLRSKTTPPNPEGGWQLSAAHWSVLLFGAWVSLTFVTARNHDVAYPYFIEYLKLFVMFWLAGRVVRTVGQAWVVYLLTAGTLGYIAYEVNYIYFFQGAYTYIYHMGYGGLDNNGAGLMLAMGVPLCYFAWEGMRRWFRWAFLAMIPLILHAVLMSYSRGAMVSLIASVPFYFLRSRRKIQLMLIVAAIAALIPILAGKEIRARFFTLEDTEIDESANLRRQSWAAAWAIARENPIFGVGIRNSNLISKEYGADMQGRTIHSQYLQTAADSGFVALALYLAALVAFWLSTRRTRIIVKHRMGAEAWQTYAMACGVEGAMIVFCVGGAFLSLETFELPYLMLLIGAQLPLVIGAAPALTESSNLAADAAMG
jgi:probable O-glycosylation ligase (exosortase A-associated)